jgi:molybdate transport system ATP-binding protein
MENDVMYMKLKKELLSSSGRMVLEVDTTIPLTKVTSLFGNSGSGKTSILRMLAGLMEPDEGYISVGDEVWFDSVNNINIPAQKRGIGFVFQDYALFPNMTVEQNISFGQEIEDLAFINNLLISFELTEFSDKKPMLLSGGQKQRVALARALARKPKLLLLDEPLNALDSEMRMNLQKEITNIHDNYGITTLLISHDIPEVFRLASHVIRINEGKIIDNGKPELVFSKPGFNRGIDFVGQIAILKAMTGCKCNQL